MTIREFEGIRGMTADEMRAAVKRLRESSRATVPCPRCGKPCWDVEVSEEAAVNLAELGYDGTCCSPVLP